MLMMKIMSVQGSAPLFQLSNGNKKPLKEGVTACLRIRPLLDVEKKDGHRVAAAFKRADRDHFKIERSHYEFDEVYAPNVRTAKIFESISPALTQFTQTNIMLYGQSGAGKTHTMFHPKDGLVYLALESLFKTYDQVKLFVVEIYNGDITLLKTGQKLALMTHKDKQMGFCDKETRSHVVPDECSFVVTRQNYRSVIEDCLSQRKVRSTPLNDKSSRSHLCIQLRYGGRLTNCYDLAGTGEVSHSEEGNAIRTDLSGLTSLIQSMSSQSKNSVIFHQRNTVFTRFVHAYLDQAHTFLLGLVSPSDKRLKLSKRTMQFVKNCSTLKIKKNRHEELYFRKIRALYAKQHDHYQLIVNKEGSIVNAPPKGLYGLGWTRQHLFERSLDSLLETAIMPQLTSQAMQALSGASEHVFPHRVVKMRANNGDLHEVSLLLEARSDKTYGHYFVAHVMPHHPHKRTHLEMTESVASSHLESRFSKRLGVEGPDISHHCEGLDCHHMMSIENISNPQEAKLMMRFQHHKSHTTKLDDVSIEISQPFQGSYNTQNRPAKQPIRDRKGSGNGLVELVSDRPLVCDIKDPLLSESSQKRARYSETNPRPGNVTRAIGTDSKVSLEVVQGASFDLSHTVPQIQSSLGADSQVSPSCPMLSFDLFHPLAIQLKSSTRYLNSPVMVHTLFEEVVERQIPPSEWTIFIKEALEASLSTERLSLIQRSDPEYNKPIETPAEPLDPGCLFGCGW